MKNADVPVIHIQTFGSNNYLTKIHILHKIWCYDQHTSFPVCILKSRAEHQSSPCRQCMLAIQYLACRPEQTELLHRALRATVNSWEIKVPPCLFPHNFSWLSPQRAAHCELTFATILLAFWLEQGPSSAAAFLQSLQSGIRHFTLRPRSAQFLEEENGVQIANCPFEFTAEKLAKSLFLCTILLFFT